MKTVRFSQIVERCGAPELHPLWIAPEQDAAFQRAVKAHRVMTVRQDNAGSKTDYGIVGYEPGGQAQFLLFPRSLQAFAGRRVVGVKYDLLRSPEIKDAFKPPPPPAPRKPAPAIDLRIVDEPSSRPPATPRSSRAEVVPFASTEKPAAPATPSPKPARAPARTAKSRRTPAPRSRAKPAAAEAPPTETALRAQVRRALKELKQGKTVAAYERLAHALAAP